MTRSRNQHHARIGIDLGGTKIEGVVLAPGDGELYRARIPTPRHDYSATLRAIVSLVTQLKTASSDPQAEPPTIGIAMPGSISPATGKIQNANSTWLNGKDFSHDLKAALGQLVLFANDANCFAMSEAADGAAAGARSVFGVILGTGVGGGLIVDGQIADGPNGIGGEWGHNPLPRPQPNEVPGPRCWCGREGCMETWVSGPALSQDHHRTGGGDLTAEDIANQAAAGDPAATATLERFMTRLGRGLASVINIADPEVIVLGGGLSNLEILYDRLPAYTAPHVFADRPSIEIRPPRWGDASGVRGAARLWDGE